MTALKYVILREILDQLRTFRFGVMFLLIQTIAIAGVLLAIEQDRQERALYEQTRSQSHKELKERMEQERGKFINVFRKSTRFCRIPSSLPFVAGAGDRSLPGLFQVSAFRVRGPEDLRAPNPTIGHAEQIDWNFICGIVLSLAALVLTFDAVSREREEKTYQMVMSNSIRRSTVIAGKGLGAFLPLMATWSLAVALQLLLWNLLAEAPLSVRDWTVILFAGVPIALFTAFLVLLGILISLLFNSSGACGTVAALCWAIFTLVIPSAGQLLAFRLQSLPDPKAAEARAEEMAAQARNAFKLEHGIGHQSSSWWFPDPLGLNLSAQEPFEKEWRNVRGKWEAQARLARSLSRLSPVATLRYSLEELANQGFPGYEEFAQQAAEYHREIRSLLLSLYPLDMNELIEGEARKKLDAVPLTLATFPAPPSRFPTTGERLVAAAPDIALLTLFAGLAFVVTLATVNRQSVTG